VTTTGETEWLVFLGLSSAATAEANAKGASAALATAMWVKTRFLV